jgi:heme exporter protein B
MARFVAQVGALLAKDARIELRTREVLYTGLLFSAVLVTLFLFSGFETAALARDAAPGVLWVSLAFVGTVVFNRTIQREREDRVLAALLLVPGAARALWVSKLALNLALLVTIELLLVPLVAVTFALDVASPVALVGVLALGTLGYCALGTVLAAALAAVRLREVLLPLVLFPLSTPLLIAGVRATEALVEGSGAVMGWVQLLVAFDVLFLVVGQWLFGQALDAES